MEKVVVKGDKVYIVGEETLRETLIPDFVDELGVAVADPIARTPVLSPHTIYYCGRTKRSGHHERVLVEIPPKVWQIQFTEHYARESGRWVDTGTRNIEIYEVAGPYLYFPLHFVKGTLHFACLRLFSRTERVRSLDDKLDIAPWPNTQDGQLCLADTAALISQHEGLSLAQRIDHVIYALMGTEFNNHNPDWCPVPGDVLTITEWAARTAENPGFVLDCKFQDAGITVKDTMESCFECR